MSEALRIHDWDEHQSYRSDRGQPPWIKVHRELMRKPKWVKLSDAQKGQLVSLWILAADEGGEIPADPALLQKLCYMDSEPDLQTFIRLGFIDDDDSVTPKRRQADDNMTAQSALARGRGREEAEAEAEADSHTKTAREVELDEFTIAKIRGLYGWEGSEGTDPVLKKAFDDPDVRDRCLEIAIDRLESERGEYRANWFRTILTTVIEEQTGGTRGDSDATGFVSYDSDYEPGGIYYTGGADG